MRTKVIFDDELLSEAFKYRRAITKRELVHQALQEIVEHHRRVDVRELRG
jgi:Arc/MetJ family transcription regulator